MIYKCKTQTILIYATLIAFVVATLMLMSGYIQRRVQGLYKQAGDAYGDGEIKN
ncbi:MAG: hypothetical protein PHU64_02205 [Candidatus Omnitrophica bacterium]|nr:hypothetical protein [Candidatus Omnitrophota bacterium]MDD5429888.1 hypothetical protein [Candidatus Omnitrophota bacterium]